MAVSEEMKNAISQDIVDSPDEIDGVDTNNFLSIPVEKLDLYEGIVCNDIIGRDGAVILPAGVDLSLLESSIDTTMKRLKAQGLTEIQIRQRPQFSAHDIETIFEKIYSGDNALIDKKQAREVVKQVDTLFDSVRQEKFEPEMITSLANIGDSLTEEIIRNPSVALSLGKVHDADKYTFIHSFNVAVLTGYLTSHLYPNDRPYTQKIVVGSLLHDIGKAQVPLEILNKPGPLDKEEFEVMKKHPLLGIEVAVKGGIKDTDVLDVIVGHHEMWSGKGYPSGRRGLEISEAARITAVADVFDALTARRVYKRPMPLRNAITLIMEDAGDHFDTRIARELLVNVGLYPPGSIVLLSNNRTGLVVSSGGKDLVRPVLMLLAEGTKFSSQNPSLEFVDLKTSQDLYILQYLGHKDKRDLGLPLSA